MAETEEIKTQNKTKADNPKDNVLLDETPKEEAKPVVDPTAKFIESKAELSRYSMAQTFREFIVKNYAKFNKFKTIEDYDKAFIEFWGGSK